MAKTVKGSIDTSVANVKGSTIDPAKFAESGTEHGHQVAFMQWIALTGRREVADDLRLIFAVPNGGGRQSSVAASMKAEGVKRGVPDLCWPRPVGEHAGLWIEMKKPSVLGQTRGGRSTEQVDWAIDLRRQHYAVVLCFDWQAAVWAVRKYWRGSLGMPENGDALFLWTDREGYVHNSMTG